MTDGSQQCEHRGWSGQHNIALEGFLQQHAISGESIRQQRLIRQEQDDELRGVATLEVVARGQILAVAKNGSDMLFHQSGAFGCIITLQTLGVFVEGEFCVDEDFATTWQDDDDVGALTAGFHSFG